MKYIAAIMVICIHCSYIFSYEPLDYFTRQIICRIAVPFFFISSAYFVKKKLNKDENYLKSYLRNLIKSYLAWSLVFVPIGLDWIHQNLALSTNLLPLALIFGLGHVGTYYHLWYIPGLIISLFLTTKLLKRFSYKGVFALSIILFLFGSLETYYGLLPDNAFRDFFDIIIKIIFTTRTGIFFGMIFTTIGYFVCDYQEKIKLILKYIPFLTIFSACLLIVEGVILYYIPNKLDMNFFIMLIPFSFFFFIWILAFPVIPNFDTKKIRELSKYYYFVHLIGVVIIEEIVKILQLNVPFIGMISFLLILLLTHLLSLVIIAIKQNKLNHYFVGYSIILGILTTIVISGAFYQIRPDDLVLKFEFVPCIFVFSCYSIYYLLFTKKQRKVI